MCKNCSNFTQIYKNLAVYSTPDHEIGHDGSFGGDTKMSCRNFQNFDFLAICGVANFDLGLFLAILVIFKPDFHLKRQKSEYWEHWGGWF